MNLVYTHDIFSAQKFGGISRYFSELIKRIPSYGGRVRVLAGLYVNEYMGGVAGVKGVKVPTLKHTGTIRMLINQLFQDIMLRRCDENTIIHQTYFTKSVANKKSKTVVTVYDMISERFTESCSSDSERCNVKKINCERADKIIAISKSTKKDLVSLFGISPDKIKVIYLASSLSDNGLRPSGRVFHEPYLLYVGKRGGYKNFNSLLQAFSRSDALKRNFHLICFGDKPFDEIEKSEFDELGVKSRIHQINGSDSLLTIYYRDAAAFIYPSVYEGFGIPLLEAMGLSCPVICSNTSSIPEVVGDAGIYFDPNNISSIQSALENTLFNESLLWDLKKRGLKRESIFSWDKCASETVAVYRSLLN